MCSESNRHDLGAGRFGQRDHQLAADDQRLLVGQSEVDALAQRGHGRAEPRRAHKCVEDQVGARLHDQPNETLGAGQDLALGPGKRRPLGRLGVSQRDPRDPVRARLLDQRLPRALGGQTQELELLLVAAHDVERLRTDRAGRAED